MPRASAMLDPPGPRLEAVGVLLTALAVLAVLLVLTGRRLMRPVDRPFAVYREGKGHG